MQRRDILKLAAGITGAAIVAPLTSSLVYASARELSKATGTPVFFNKAQLSFIADLADTILPRTTTPSATDVNVHMMMDHMLNTVRKPAYQKSFLQKLASLQTFLAEKGFAKANSADKLSIVKALETRAQTTKDAVSGAYLDIKQQSISYYLASQEIAEKHLNYLPIPIQYIPCISLKDVGGKKWAE